MNTNIFWQIIENCNTERDYYEHPGIEYQSLLHNLRALPDKDIVDFYSIWSLYLQLAGIPELWIATNIIERFRSSEESFISLRNFVIMRGQSTYNSILKNPDALAFIPYRQDPVWNNMNNVAIEALQLKNSAIDINAYCFQPNPDLIDSITNGQPLPDDDIEFSNVADEKQLFNQFPNLMSRYKQW